MDKPAEDGTKAKGTQIKVKFKGSKLAIGSSKMPNAVVSTYFMTKLTALNISMLGGTPVAPVKKKQKTEEADRVEEEGDRSRRRRVTIAANPTEIQLPLVLVQPPQAPPSPPRAPDCIDTIAPNLNQKISTAVKPASRVKSEVTVSAMTVEVAPASSHVRTEGEVPDRTVGGLCLPTSVPASTSTSTLYALQHNRKHFLKTVEALDPAEMDVTCDFDFWLWLESQKLFAPFSYKTHDLSVVALQDIGKEEVLSRWSFPPLGNRRAVDAVDPSHSNSHPTASSSTSSNVMTAASSSAHHAAGIEHHIAQAQAPGQGQSVLSALLHSSTPASGIAAPRLSNGHHVCTSNSSTNNVNSCMDSCISSSSSAGVRRQDLSASNRGVDDGPDCVSCLDRNLHPMPTAAASSVEMHGALLAGLDGMSRPDLVSTGLTVGAFVSAMGVEGGDAADGGGGFDATEIGCPVPQLVDDDSPSIDSYLEQLQEELLRNNLEVNATIARLRRESLQSPAVRGELDAHMKQQDREKAVITKWRKSKSYLASHAANSSNSTGSASSAGAGNGKAKSTYKKKLGTY